MGVDSGASISMLPKGVFTDYPLVANKREITYMSATNHPVKDLGGRALVGFTPDTEVARGIRFRVGDIRKPLMAAAEMVDAGHKVVFDKEGGKDVSYALHKATGQYTKFTRAGNVYNLDLVVMPFSEVRRARESPFEGRAELVRPARGEIPRRNAS